MKSFYTLVSQHHSISDDCFRIRLAVNEQEKDNVIVSKRINRDTEIKAPLSREVIWLQDCNLSSTHVVIITFFSKIL